MQDAGAVECRLPRFGADNDQELAVYWSLLILPPEPAPMLRRLLPLLILVLGVVAFLWLRATGPETASVTPKERSLERLRERFGRTDPTEIGESAV